jgi:hypothetical protein
MKTSSPASLMGPYGEQGCEMLPRPRLLVERIFPYLHHRGGINFLISIH